MEQPYSQSDRAYICSVEKIFILSFLTEEVRLLIDKVILLPTLFYGIEIFGICDTRDLRILTVAFNSVVCYVFNLRRFDHVSKLTNNILDLNLTSWIDLRTLIFFYKIVTSGEPKYILNKLTPATSVRTKNYICPRLWNNLPHQHKTIRSATQFYNKVKDLLKYISIKMK